MVGRVGNERGMVISYFSVCFALSRRSKSRIPRVFAADVAK